MPQKANIKTPLIQIRINAKEKEDWVNYQKTNKFSSLSALIRFSVNEIMEKGIKLSIDNGKDAKYIDQMKLMNESMKLINEQVESLRDENKQLKKDLSKRRETVDTHDLKGRILNQLETYGSQKSEKLAQGLKEDETDVITMCNTLEEQGLIKQNKDMEYEVIN